MKDKTKAEVFSLAAGTYSVPAAPAYDLSAVMSDAQFAALAMGAHPYKVVQLHWHNAAYTDLLEKMGIDWKAAWGEFEEELEQIKAGKKEFLTWEDVG